MLLELNIKDFAIIDNLHLTFHRLFNVFTGETGAGKSIIIDAVSALLGGKIGAEYVRAGCERASVEGVFSLETLLPPGGNGFQPLARTAEGEEEAAAVGNTLYEALEQVENQEGRRLERLQADLSSADARVALASLLQEYGLQPEDGTLILSRDIFRSGRTVSRINGRAVSQHVLQQVASWLIDIHGQSEHLSLLRPEQHVNFLDRYAELLPLREQLAARVSEWRTVRKNLQQLMQAERDESRRAEFLRFEIEEIEKAELQPGEIEELERERKVLSNAERMRELCALVYGAIKGSELASDLTQSALDLLRSAARALNELARLDKSLAEQEANLDEAIYRLEDVAAAISSYETDIEDDPARLAEIEERLDLIARLKRKYGATIEEILRRAEEDRQELDRIVNREEHIHRLEQQDQQLRREIGRIAQELSERRRAAAARLASAMEEQLDDLNMKRARFAVEILQEPDPEGVPATINGQPQMFYACDATGIDRIQFLIAPNPGEPFKPLTKIASGGETSRLMLALKTILARADATPTLIFDEIDSGISGRSGQVVAEKLWMLTRNHQVICVTHLPQIAAFADLHFNVNKQVLGERTITIVNELRPEQRVREIAHIMGGNVSEFSLKSAEELLARSQLWKENWLRQVESQTASQTTEQTASRDASQAQAR
ncbi:MAG: DNA repair protein RecN [Thermogemmatispora sp.]|uniref:DNA repair protein RecN n=1 Tax=Thermogemmatispora sp. TaxID=1968838 RepID=UPI00261056E9|nr:DNA repair protein RecN [Thermogemmatispora sp.]MBX5458033.1 DNA repair protein RecN [Thermogemmatispora sp.]